MQRGFVFHIRLTKKCNASCSYCSSFTEDDSIISLDDLRKCVDFASRKILSLSEENFYKFVSVQYLGGELLIVKNIQEYVDSVREILGHYFDEVRDGVQSNLIGSKKRIINLYRIFHDRIGTSVDNFGTDRSVDGSHEKYKEMLNQSIKILNERNVNPGRIFVIDKKGLDFVIDEVALSQKFRYPLTLRPVFSGGSPVLLPDEEKLAKVMKDAYNLWIRECKAPVEPFMHLTKSRLVTGYGIKENLDFGGTCPFQYDCQKKSIDIEPNGDLYVCQDMADSKQYRLGNGIKEEWNDEVWRLVGKRYDLLPIECKSCKYFEACRGGCMSEASGLNKINPHCLSWKSVFSAVDDKVKEYGLDAIFEKIKGINR